MKKLLSLLYILIPIFAFAQTDTLVSKTPEIELPDFVITGTTKIDMPTQMKETPDVISALSEQFILPKIGVESLELEGLTDPTKLQAKIKDSLEFNNFRFTLGAGLNQLPFANAFYSQRVNRFKINAYGSLSKVRNYMPNSGYHDLLLGGSTTYIIRKESEPPARINIAGSFNQHYFSPFVSPTDNKFRSSNLININGSFENLFWKEFNVDLGGFSDIHYLSDYNSSHFNFSPFISAKSSFEHFILSARFNPSLLKSSTSTSESNLILALSSEMQLRKIFNRMNIIVNVDYQSRSETGSQFLAPSASIGVGILNNLSIGVLYQNRLVQLTPPTLWKKNPYTDTLHYRHNYERIKNKIGFVLRFYTSRLMNVEFNISQYSHLGKIMFVPSITNTGYFDIVRLDAKVMEAILMANLSFGGFGDLFGSVRYLDSKLNLNSKSEPFSPRIQANIEYVYKFAFSLLLRLRFLYNSVSYSDIGNNSRISDLADLGFCVEYEITKYLRAGLETSNIFNRRNYRWINYQLKSIDLLLYLSTNL
ncbi:MAG: hypothetical protein FJ213_09920 [Ignavibacteria bacterium]|nr:hypothetical protein [Ignavibacteria bacterium]